MFERDYVMKMIHELVRTILKLLFHIDDVDDSIQIENEEANELYSKVIHLMKEYHINEAENYLYENLDESNLEELKVSLLFYDYLNQLSDEELEQADFSREEIKDGVQLVLRKFGYDGISTAF
jgi:Family of unknown function (DUF6483)